MFYSEAVKVVVRVKLLPTPAQAMALSATLAACNEAAGWVSEIAFRTGRMSRSALQKECYPGLKDRGLSAQPALHVIRKTADAYTVLEANVGAGNLTGKSRARAKSKPITFRPDAA
ncbi:hypothetical protein [Lentzea albida]|uniref:Transposase n=1 Tax=Lentzea albida TaxID=65499 RepID=A0A1H9KPD8_9PSEU|nr:hypothetical protein [Lentzea albida]SER01031.1 hypothetical protein SAMN04488000_105430 [Lentzea albida]